MCQQADSVKWRAKTSKSVKPKRKILKRTLNDLSGNFTECILRLCVRISELSFFMGHLRKSWGEAQPSSTFASAIRAPTQWGHRSLNLLAEVRRSEEVNLYEEVTKINPMAAPPG